MIHPFVEGYLNKEAGWDDIKKQIWAGITQAGDWASDNPEAAGAIAGGVGGVGLGALTGGQGNRLGSALLGGALGAGGGAAAGYGYRQHQRASGLEEDVGSLKEEKGDLTSKLTSTKEELSSTSDKASKLTKSLSAIKAEKEKLENELKKAKNTLSYAEQRSLVTQINQLEKELSEATSGLTEKTQTVESLKRLLSDATKRHRDFVSTRSELDNFKAEPTGLDIRGGLKQTYVDPVKGFVDKRRSLGDINKKMESINNVINSGVLDENTETTLRNTYKALQKQKEQIRQN